MPIAIMGGTGLGDLFGGELRTELVPTGYGQIPVRRGLLPAKT